MIRYSLLIAAITAYLAIGMVWAYMVNRHHARTAYGKNTWSGAHRSDNEQMRVYQGLGVFYTLTWPIPVGVIVFVSPFILMKLGLAKTGPDIVKYASKASRILYHVYVPMEVKNGSISNHR